MSCPVSSTSGLFNKLPIIIFEIVFVYLLITRFSIGFVCISGGFFVAILLYCIYLYKYKYQRLYDFKHDGNNINDKYISLPSISSDKDTEQIVVYCYKIGKKSNIMYPFASPHNFNLSSTSVPFQEINGNEFINSWKDDNQIIKPYCIDPFDLSVWFININNENIQSFNSRLASYQYNWNKTCESYSYSNCNDCILYRISKVDFIKLCKLMQMKNLIKNMKFMSSHLCLIYDTDYNNKCSTAYNLGYAMKLLSTDDKCDNSIQFISNHCALTGLQFRLVQLRRSMNNSEIKKFKSKLIMLLHNYFLLFYGNTCSNSNSNTNNKVVLGMNSFDIFWNDFLLIALPGVKRIFVYQSVYKSIEIAYNKYSEQDSICYFLSFFCLDDIYIRYCTSYPYYYMLQETIDKFEEFHSDFIHNGDGNGDVNVNIHTRDMSVLSGRDAMFDLSCQILALFIYVMHCLDNNKTKQNGITEMKHNFYMIRYDTDVCDKGTELISSLLVKLGWNTNTTNLQNKNKVIKLLQSTQHKNYHPKLLNEQQLKRLSFLFVQYESCDYVRNIQ